MAGEDRIADEAAADVEADQASRSQWSETLARAQAMMREAASGMRTINDPLNNAFSTKAAHRKFWNDMKSWMEDKRGVFGGGVEQAQQNVRMFGTGLYRTTPDGKTECVDPGTVKAGVPVETSRTDTLQVYRDAALEIMKREGIENPEQYLVSGQRPPDTVRALVDAGLMGSYPHWLKTDQCDGIAPIAEHPRRTATNQEILRAAAATRGLIEAVYPKSEYLNMPYHFLVCDGCDPDVMEWCGMAWLHTGQDESVSPEQMHQEGYRYLGPAEYVPTRPACATDWAAAELYGSVVAERDRLINVLRDNAVVPIFEYENEISCLVKERDEEVAHARLLAVEISKGLAKLFAKDARIAELKTELALRPAAFVDPALESVKPNPFREHKTDPRRMGR